jgi:hypothetical protein
VKSGDLIKVTHLATRVTGTIIEVETHRKAYIVLYKAIPSGTQAMLVCFPEYQYLPLTPSPDLSMYASTAYVEWENHIWPVPIGIPNAKGSRVIHGDPRTLARKRIDHVLWLIDQSHMTGSIILFPRTEEEQRVWSKWYPHY